MKRVLLITDIFPPMIGGPATFIDRLAHYLSGKGYKVTVVCSSERAVEESDRDRPFTVRRVNLSNRVAYEILVRLVLFWEMLKHRNILVNGLELYAYQIATILRRSYLLKVVGDPVWERARNRGTTTLNIDQFQTSEKEQDSWKALVQRRNKYIELAWKIFTPSHYLREIVIGWGCKGDRVVTVFNGVEEKEYSQFQPSVRKGEVLEVLFVGRLTNWKGVETLLLAVLDLDNVKVTIVGDGPEYSHLVELSQQLHLQEKVRFAGRLGRDQVRQQMLSAHVLVLTSLYEGLSHTLLEASAIGLPCIASDCGGNPETISSGENGLLIPPQNIEALREALKKLQANEEFRYRLAVGAKVNSHRFKLEETVSKIAALMDEKL